MGLGVMGDVPNTDMSAEMLVFCCEVIKHMHVPFVTPRLLQNLDFIIIYPTSRRNRIIRPCSSRIPFTNARSSYKESDQPYINKPNTHTHHKTSTPVHHSTPSTRDVYPAHSTSSATSTPDESKAYSAQVSHVHSEEEEVVD